MYSFSCLACRAGTGAVLAETSARGFMKTTTARGGTESAGRCRLRNEVSTSTSMPASAEGLPMGSEAKKDRKPRWAPGACQRLPSKDIGPGWGLGGGADRKSVGWGKGV